MACVWVLGFELGPNLHLALHAHLPAHSHGESEAPAGPRVSVHYGEYFHVHAHGGSYHAHAHDPGSHTHSRVCPHTHQRLRRAVSGGRCEWTALAPAESAPSSHGAHSLAHRGLVLLQPPPPPIFSAPLDTEPVAHLEPSTDQLRTRRPLVMRVRGPPDVGFEDCAMT